MAPKPRPGADHLQPLRSPDYKAMADEHSRPSSPDRVSRSSFSSIREHESTLPQTFSHSKISSYFGADNDEAIVDSTPTSPGLPSPTPSSSSRGFNMIQTQFQPPVTHPNSKLLGYWTPADSFQGWKGIQVKGKLASKSFGDLQVLNQVFNGAPSRPTRRGQNRPGNAAIERLPTEILTAIINLLALDVPPNGLTRRNVDLMSLLLTSRTLHVATLSTLYTRITIPHSRIFHKFLTHITAHPELGTIVRRLDFCHFNPSQLFSTAAERSRARNLTSETLLRCLELTPLLQEFLGQEYIDEDLDAARLSLHKCLTLPSSVFEALLPRLTRLTHLDVAGTRITDAALESIPPTARITHLNLAKCTLLSARAVTDFLARHPAVRNLQFLSLATDARSHQSFDADDITQLLPVLPRSLKSLSLKGSKMAPSHIDLLRPLTKNLEELALGRAITLKDVNRLFVPDEDDSDDVAMQIDWVPHSLRYLDLSDFWGAELDLVYLFGSRCAVLKGFSEPLEVVELAEDVMILIGSAGRGPLG
ncbi:hypothetical protein N0V88_000067 [Collariella sp. IMI 366227]|nr:hypothetical protein N0V88_000067 [Collariella sp. IMI 366227]